MVEYNKIKPAFENCDNCIVLCTDNGFAPATAVAIQSIIETANKENYYDILIFHSRVSELMQKVISEMEKPENVSIRFVNVENITNSSIFYTNNRKTITMEAYYRLFAPWILSEDYRFAFYIDGDMIATKDVYTVFETPIGDNLIAAVRDYWGICNCYMKDDPRREYQQSIGIENVDNYVISATILFNLQEFRERFTLEKVLKLCTEKEWLQHDQDVVNLLCQNHIYFLSAAWGMVSDYGNNRFLPQHLKDELERVTDPILIHFANVRKPWNRVFTDHYLEFWKLAEKTPFFEFLIDKIASEEYRAYILGLLSDGKFDCAYTDSDVYLSYKGIRLSPFSEGFTRFYTIKIKKDVLTLEGYVGFFGVPLDSEIEVFVKIGEELYPVDYQYTDNPFRKTEGVSISRGEGFEFEHKLSKEEKEYEITIACRINGYLIEKHDLSFDVYAPITKRYENSYYYSNGWLVTTDTEKLFVKVAKSKDKRKCEQAYRRELKQSGKEAEVNAFYVRSLVSFLRKFKKRPIWLVADRRVKADDNGEVFFKFLNEKKKREINSYFIISKDSVDYKRLKKIGKVIEPYSAKHRIIHLLADYVVSSQTDLVYRNPFRKSKRAYSDIMSDVKFVFLQHGVIHNDISGWLRKKRQAFTGFVATTEKERNSLIRHNYNYKEEEIWLTGMPRFDRLQNNSEKLITIMPTWRRYLTTGQSLDTGIWNLCDNFDQTDYAVFYRNLMNSEKLREAADKYGYTIQFKIHPSFLTHEEEFGFNDEVKIVGDEVSYTDIYSKSSLLVTDFSSAIYDFVYLRKPIIYCQFDREDFFSNHMTDNVQIDYENEGYGEVTYDLDSTINTIVEYMENGCELKDKYRERADKFFAFNDRNNCERIYQKMIELDK